MKKILGGLLVISLLSRPSLLQVDFIAYEIYKASDQIIRGIRDLHDLEKEQDGGFATLDDIDSAFGDVDRSAKSISHLMADLDETMEQLNAAMLAKAVSKETLTEEQIDSFSTFSAYYTDETERLSGMLSQLSGESGIDGLKSGILTLDTDYDKLYDQLTDVHNRQYEAIATINAVIQAAEKTLSLIA